MAAKNDPYAPPHAMWKWTKLQKLKSILSPLQQRINDAKALTLEQWRPELELVRRVEIGFKCGVVDKGAASFAFQAIMMHMDNEKANNGLINDASLFPLKEVEKAIKQEGNVIADLKADPAFCSKFFANPADRERLRRRVEAMMR